jgi:hypothetical protein
MKVEFVMLADAAQAVGGKLYILGGAWNQFRCTSFPVQMPVSIVTSILIENNETDRTIPVTTVLADEEGVPIIPEAQAELRIGKQETNGPHRALLAVNASLQIPHAGRYAVQVTAGDAVNSIYFDVIFVGKRVDPIPPASTPLH